MTDEEIMKKAIELAKISGDEGEVPVGAVVTKNGEIVATGRNRREIGKNALYHAELEAIDNACKALGAGGFGNASFMSLLNRALCVQVQ